MVESVSAPRQRPAAVVAWIGVRDTLSRRRENATAGLDLASGGSQADWPFRRSRSSDAQLSAQFVCGFREFMSC